MICYKDKTFCPFDTCANFGSKCNDSLTEQVTSDARRWWGSDEAPISQYIAKPDCFISAEAKDDD